MKIRNKNCNYLQIKNPKTFKLKQKMYNQKVVHPKNSSQRLGTPKWSLHIWSTCSAINTNFTKIRAKLKKETKRYKLCKQSRIRGR